VVRWQLLICALCALFVVACGATGSPTAQTVTPPLRYNLTEPQVTLLSPSVVQLSGPITPDAVQLVAQTAPETVTTLRIRSHGGPRLAGLDLADLVRARNWSVSVYDFCLSGCAHFVLVAGRRRYIEDGAFLLFHQTDSGLIAMMRNHTPDATLETYLAGLERESVLYKESNVDPALLVLPLAALEDICGTLIFDAQGSVVDLRVRRRMSAAWTGSTRALASFGLTFEGEVPENVEELQSRLVAVGMYIPTSSIRFASERRPEQEQAVIARHMAMPLCSPPLAP
jgi:hypothetical protein